MWITVDKSKNISLSRQIYNQIKKMILEGSLSEKEKIPSSRELSKELLVSRNTVLESYNQLIAEGFLEGRQGSKTCVATGISKYQIPVCPPEKKQNLSTPNIIYNSIDFRSGIPDLTKLPKKELGKLYQTICIDLPDTAFRYQSTAGVMDLRQAIARYLFRIRGINCDPNHIVIVSGATQGLSIISRLLYRENAEVFIENPTHPGLRKVISNTGLSLTGIRVDDSGINIDLLPSSKDVSFIYTTPSHQYPLGSILSIQRRIALIQYAVSNNCFLIEDDYDSEYRYEGQPIHSLYELNPHKVIYIGTFSKILSPSLRIGYVVLPKELITPFLEFKKFTDVHTESLTQYVLAKFIENGGLEKHILTMKRLYAKKRAHLIQELSFYFPDEFNIKGQAAGLHVIVKFLKISFTKELMNKIHSNNVKIYPVRDFEFQDIGNHENEFLLGYAHLDLAQISEGIRILSQILH